MFGSASATPSGLRSSRTEHPQPNVPRGGPKQTAEVGQAKLPNSALDADLISLPQFVSNGERELSTRDNVVALLAIRVDACAVHSPRCARERKGCGIQPLQCCANDRSIANFTSQDDPSFILHIASQDGKRGLIASRPLFATLVVNSSH